MQNHTHLGALRTFLCTGWNSRALLCALTLILFGLCVLSGCAAKVGDDGTAVVGFRLGEVDGSDTAAVGRTAGSALGGAVAGPGGAAIGGAVGEWLGWGLAALGIGGTAVAARRATKHAVEAASANSLRKGERDGWDEHSVAAARGGGSVAVGGGSTSVP